jgi:hypothetical protein
MRCKSIAVVWAFSVITELLQIRTFKPTSIEGECQCSGHLDPPFSRSPHRRPHPFPVQWISLRDTDFVTRASPTDVDDTDLRAFVCSTTVSQAHLSISCTSLLCLPVADVLP